MLLIETSFSPADAALQQLSQAVIAHDRASAGAPLPRPLACLARHGGLLIGGVSGHLEQHRLCVDFLYVDAQHRRQGLGHRLLETIEAAAASAGCTECQLETLSDDTAAMYRRAGYRSLARIDDYLPGRALQVLRKPLLRAARP